MVSNILASASVLVMRRIRLSFVKGEGYICIFVRISLCSLYKRAASLAFKEMVDGDQPSVLPKHLFIGRVVVESLGWCAHDSLESGFCQI